MSLASLHKFSRVILNSFFFRFFKKELVPFDTPVLRFRWVGNRRKRRHRLILASFKRSNQRSMSSHAEPGNPHIIPGNREVARHDIGKFLSDVGEHLEVVLGCAGSSVDVVTGAVSELPVFGDVSDVCVAGGGVREYAGYAVFFGVRAETGFYC